ncbi:MAG: desulfoferrodoxin [Firmicutes bacterium]|nr:desulfoferrodoxin [Bacillota bacterium]
MSKQKFFICKHCGNLIGLIDNRGVPVVCCGETMAELVPNTAEASAEKHLPVLSAEGNTLTVAVGAAPHPMEDAHHIAFVYVETERGGQRKRLKPGEETKVVFNCVDDKPVAVYAYCNLHGLWKTEI